MVKRFVTGLVEGVPAAASPHRWRSMAPPARIAVWGAGLTGMALCVRALALGAAPPPAAVAVVVACATFAVVGVLVPQLGMFGDVLSSGDPATRAVALTFDDGPDPDTTPKVLDILARAQVRATFFVIGAKAERHPEVVRAIAAAGHSLGVHGYRHDRLYALLRPDTVVEDVRRTQDVVERITGVRPRWFRPPVGQVSPRTAEGARRAGVRIVAWSIRGRDGLASATPDGVASRIERGLRPGGIVLLHDAAERGDRAPVAIQALPRVLDAVRRQGLRVMRLEELVGG